MKRHAARAALVTLLLAATSVLAYIAFFAFQTAMAKNDRIPPPEATKPYRHDSTALTKATAAAIRYQHEPVQTINVSVSPEDFPDFNGHLNNIAAQQDWLLHSSGKTQVYIVIPEDQVPLIEGMSEGGAEWLLNHTLAKDKPRNQPSANLVNVRLQLKPRMGTTVLLVITIIVSGTAAAATLTMAATHAKALLKELSKPRVPDPR